MLSYSLVGTVILKKKFVCYSKNPKHLKITQDIKPIPPSSVYFVAKANFIRSYSLFVCLPFMSSLDKWSISSLNLLQMCTF